MKLGSRIKELRESQGLLQRQLSAEMEIDTPMFSKIERGERRAKKEQILKIAEILKVEPKELLSLWLAEQVLEILQNQDEALEVIEIVLKDINK